MAYTDLKNKLDECNWDDGFEVPRTILADPDCDLALALEIFYLAGGYEYLEKSARRTKLQKWNPFITVLYEDILDNRFPKTDASFEIPLSKVQKYKLRKSFLRIYSFSFIRENRTYEQRIIDSKTPRLG